MSGYHELSAAETDISTAKTDISYIIANLFFNVQLSIKARPGDSNFSRRFKNEFDYFCQNLYFWDFMQS